MHEKEHKKLKFSWKKKIAYGLLMSFASLQLAGYGCNKILRYISPSSILHAGECPKNYVSHCMVPNKTLCGPLSRIIDDTKLLLDKNDNLSEQLCSKEYTQYTNSQGYIGEELTRDLPTGINRIFCLGGSTTLGTCSTKLKDSYPYNLDKILNSRHKTKFEVINTGVSGYTAKEMTSLLANEIIPLFKFDIVIVQEPVNHVHRCMDFGGTTYDGLLPPNYTIYKYFPLSLTFKKIDMLRHYIQLARQSKIKGNKINYEYGYPTKYRDVELPSLKRYLEDIVTLSKEHNFKLIFGKWPTLFTNEKGTLKDVGLWVFDCIDPNNAAAEWFDLLNATARTYREVAEANDIPFVVYNKIENLAYEEKEKDIFCDYYHIKEAGAILMADELADEIKKMYTNKY